VPSSGPSSTTDHKPTSFFPFLAEQFARISPWLPVNTLKLPHLEHGICKLLKEQAAVVCKAGDNAPCPRIRVQVLV